MFSLTRQEQLVIVAMVAALLIGAGVKRWRAQHSVPTGVATAELASEPTP